MTFIESFMTCCFKANVKAPGGVPYGPNSFAGGVDVELSKQLCKESYQKEHEGSLEDVQRLVSAIASGSEEGWLQRIDMAVRLLQEEFEAESASLHAVYEGGFAFAILASTGVGAEEQLRGVPQSITHDLSSSIAVLLSAQMRSSSIAGASCIRASAFGGSVSAHAHPHAAAAASTTTGSGPFAPPSTIRSSFPGFLDTLPPDWQQLYGRHGLRHFIAVPLSSGDIVAGVLTLASRSGDLPPPRWRPGVLAAVGSGLALLLQARQVAIATSTLTDVHVARNVDELVRAVRRGVYDIVCATTYLPPAIRVALIRADGSTAAVFEESGSNHKDGFARFGSETSGPTGVPEMLQPTPSRKSLDVNGRGSWHQVPQASCLRDRTMTNNNTLFGPLNPEQHLAMGGAAAAAAAAVPASSFLRERSSLPNVHALSTLSSNPSNVHMSGLLGGGGARGGTGEQSPAARTPAASGGGATAAAAAVRAVGIASLAQSQSQAAFGAPVASTVTSPFSTAEVALPVRASAISTAPHGVAAMPGGGGGGLMGGGGVHGGGGTTVEIRPTVMLTAPQTSLGGGGGTAEVGTVGTFARHGSAAAGGGASDSALAMIGCNPGGGAAAAGVAVPASPRCLGVAGGGGGGGMATQSMLQERLLSAGGLTFGMSFCSQPPRTASNGTVGGTGSGPKQPGARGHSLSLVSTLLGEVLQKECGLWISDCTLYLQEAKSFPRDIVVSRESRSVHSIAVCAGRHGAVPLLGVYCVYGAVLPRQLLRAVTLELEQLMKLLAPCVSHRLCSAALVDEWLYLHEEVLDPAKFDHRLNKRGPRQRRSSLSIPNIDVTVGAAGGGGGAGGLPSPGIACEASSPPLPLTTSRRTSTLASPTPAVGGAGGVGVGLLESAPQGVVARVGGVGGDGSSVVVASVGMGVAASVGGTGEGSFVPTGRISPSGRPASDTGGVYGGDGGETLPVAPRTSASVTGTPIAAAAAAAAAGGGGGGGSPAAGGASTAIMNAWRALSRRMSRNTRMPPPDNVMPSMIDAFLVKEEPGTERTSGGSRSSTISVMTR
ncbi:hypothetical protein Agub_g2185, partial [Astrephomene gubernaculifera]